MGQELHRVALTYRMPWGEESSGITLVDMYLAELATRTWPGPPGSWTSWALASPCRLSKGHAPRSTSVPQRGRGGRPVRSRDLPISRC
jgi:hypothetical protein